MSVSPPSAQRPIAVDPELHLRRQGERSLVPGTQAPHESPLGLIGSALVAVGVLDQDLASSIVFDYSLARRLRPGDHGFPFTFQAQREPVAAPQTPTVARLVNADQRPDETFPYAMLSAQRAEIAVTYRGSDNWPVVAKGFPNPGNFPHSVPMADDTGTTHQAMFNGGGGNGEWIGRFVSEQPFSLASRWLELGGLRFTLDRQAAPVDVRVEELPSTTPGADFLRHRQASADRLPSPEIDPVIEALIVTGALASDDPVLDEIKQVWNAGPTVTGRVPPAVRRRMLQKFAAMPPVTAPSLSGGAQMPAPWSRYDPQRVVSGPTGTVLIGASSPVIEGAAVTFHALASEVHGFTVDTEQFGGPPDHHFANYVVDPTPGFAWWAEDDLSNLYRGHWSGWSGSGNGRRGDIAYAPALEPMATRLRLLPTLRSHRAVVDVALPDWQAAT
ncbi:MAG TPA: hypothetical protein VHX15_20625 [Frankiaceae bacterium]|jgi:hypothetical protein|nr:hypothetical protein [Frankiaceae bacterium]